jgi:hypothetical protein
MLIFVPRQCIVGRSFAQTSIGEVTGALDKSQTCELLIRSLKDCALGRSLKDSKRLI